MAEVKSLFSLPCWCVLLPLLVFSTNNESTSTNDYYYPLKYNMKLLKFNHIKQCPQFYTATLLDSLPLLVFPTNNGEYVEKRLKLLVFHQQWRND